MCGNAIGWPLSKSASDHVRINKTKWRITWIFKEETSSSIHVYGFSPHTFCLFTQHLTDHKNEYLDIQPCQFTTRFFIFPPTLLQMLCKERNKLCCLTKDGACYRPTTSCCVQTTPQTGAGNSRSAAPRTTCSPDSHPFDNYCQPVQNIHSFIKSLQNTVLHSSTKTLIWLMICKRLHKNFSKTSSQTICTYC